MKSVARFFRTRHRTSMSTVLARRNLSRTMPGETGAMASLRLTGIGL